MNIEDLLMLLREACRHRHVHVVKYLIDKYTVIFDNDFVHDLIKSTNYYSEDDIVPMRDELYINYLIEETQIILDHNTIRNLCESACRYGRIDVFKSLQERYRDLAIYVDMENLLNYACWKEFSVGNLEIIKYLLEKGVNPSAGEDIEKIIPEIGNRIDSNGPVPLFFIKFLEASLKYIGMDEKTYVEPFPKKVMIENLLDAIKNPSEGNITKIVSNPDFNIEDVQSVVGWSIPLLRNKIKKPVVMKITEHLSSVENILHDRLQLLRPPDLDNLTLVQLLEIEWECLLLDAARNPTENNMQVVETFKKKYEEKGIFSLACNKLYEDAKSFLASRLSMLPKSLLQSKVFYNLSFFWRNQIRCLNKMTKNIVEDSDEAVFSYAFPIAYAKI